MTKKELLAKGAIEFEEQVTLFTVTPKDDKTFFTLHIFRPSDTSSRDYIGQGYLQTTDKEAFQKLAYKMLASVL